MITSIYIGITAAVISWSFVCLLCDTGEIFGRFPVWLEGLGRSNVFFKILTCERCLAGQLALWVYPAYTLQCYNLWGHIFAANLAVLIAAFITFIFNKLE
jgi:hypothetical protein